MGSSCEARSLNRRAREMSRREGLERHRARADGSTSMPPSLYHIGMATGRRPTLRAAAIAAIILMFGVSASGVAGCAHYGWTSTGKRVAVETVGVKADEGLEPSSLTRRLVESLARAGIEATWNGEGPILRCQVTVSQVSGGDVVAPGARAECTLDGATVEASATRAATVSNATSRDVRTARQFAAEAAIDAVAPRVAQTLVTDD